MSTALDRVLNEIDNEVQALQLEKKKPHDSDIPNNEHISKVIPGLYVGSVEAEMNAIGLKARGITHILSVALHHVPSHSDQFKYKLIPLLDMDEANILQYFPECIDFITGALQDGAILVHCMAGYSRSVSVVVTYLMATQQHFKNSFDLALAHVVKVRPNACPNYGFCRQIKQFQKMGYKKKHTLDSVGDGSTKIETGQEVSPSQELIFTCKKCRKLLFESYNIENHEVGIGIKKTGPKGKMVEIPECTSHFIEQMPWLGNLDNIEGKIYCNKCNTKIGTYAWPGMTCSCGTWIVPAFQILRNKVDTKPKYN